MELNKDKNILQLLSFIDNFKNDNLKHNNLENFVDNLKMILNYPVITKEEEDLIKKILCHANFLKVIFLFLKDNFIDESTLKSLMKHIRFEDIIIELQKSNMDPVSESIFYFLNYYFLFSSEEYVFRNEELDYLLKLKNKNFKSLSRPLLYFFIKKKDSQSKESLKYIKQFTEENLILNEEKNKINLINFDSINSKIDEFSKNSFNLKSNSNLEKLEKLIKIKSDYSDKIKEELILRNIIEESIILNKSILSSHFNESSTTIEKLIELIKNIEDFIAKITYLINKNCNDLNSIKSYFMTKIKFLTSQLNTKYNELIENNICILKEKSIIFKDLYNDSTFQTLESLTQFDPLLITSFLQNLYDNIISYFPNKNYNFLKKGNTKAFSIELKIDKSESREDRYEKYKNLIGLVEEIKLILDFLSESSILKTLIDDNQNQSHFINHEIYFNGTPKKTRNNFIFVLSYNIEMVYKIFKESVLENLQFNSKSQDIEIYSQIGSIYRRYIIVCNEISSKYNTVKNFKFYDNLDSKIFNSKIKSNDSDVQNYFNLRNLITSSYIESKELKFVQYKLINLIEEIFSFKLIENENKIIMTSNVNYLYFNLNSSLLISKSFPLIIKNILNKDEIQKDQEKFNKKVSLLFSIYNEYSKLNELSSSEFSDVILLYNNIESLILCFEFFSLFEKNSIELKNEIINIIKLFKNLSSSIINEIISNFIKELIGELSIFESFEDLRYERNYQNIEKIIKCSLDLIFNFFNLFQEFANETILFYHLNCILSLFFDILNRKIFSVKDFNLDDTKALFKLSKLVVVEFKKKLELMIRLNPNSLASPDLSNILEKNNKFKKFEEILFILNANMRDIKNFIIQFNFKLHIDPLELIDLIKSTFEDNEKRENLINFINEKMLK